MALSAGMRLGPYEILKPLGAGGMGEVYKARDNSERSGVYVGSLDSKQSKRLLDVQSTTQYAPSGHLLFVREGALMAQPFDLASLEIRGAPTALAQQVNVSFGFATFSASSNGVVTCRELETIPTSRGSPATAGVASRSPKAIDTLR